MGIGGIFLLDPASKPEGTGMFRNPRLKSVEGITVGVVDNTKPNFDLFMDTVCEQLQTVYKVGKVIRYRKPGRTMGVSADVLADISEKCDFVFTGLGD